MDCNEEHSSWPYWPNDWPDSYLLEEEALLSSLPFPSFCRQPLCSSGSAVGQSSIPQGEIETNFEDDVQRYWDDESREGSEKGLPLLCYSEENGAASNTMTTDRVRPEKYQLEEEALQSNLPFPSFYYQPSCSGGQISIPQGELNTNFEDDVLRYWDDDKSREGSEKGLPLLCYSAENAAAPNTMTTDRVRPEKVLTFELVSQHFYMPIAQAARELDVGLTVLKKRCRELGIPRWPHRKMKSLQALINNIEVLQEAGKAEDGEQLRAMVEMLEQERRLLEQKPCVELKETTKRLRQACFKAGYKKRRVLALEAAETSKLY